MFAFHFILMRKLSLELNKSNTYLFNFTFEIAKDLNEMLN